MRAMGGGVRVFGCPNLFRDESWCWILDLDFYDGFFQVLVVRCG